MNAKMETVRQLRAMADALEKEVKGNESSSPNLGEVWRIDGGVYLCALHPNKTDGSLLFVELDSGCFWSYIETPEQTVETHGGHYLAKDVNTYYEVVHEY